MDQYKITITSNGEPQPDPSGTGMVEPAAPSGAFSVTGGSGDWALDVAGDVIAWMVRVAPLDAAKYAAREYSLADAIRAAVERHRPNTTMSRTAAEKGKSP